MAKDKRHSVLSDMNAMNMSDMGAMTDQEREQLGVASQDPAKKVEKRKKAM